MLLNCMIIRLVVHFICLAQVFSLNVDGKYFFPYLVLFFFLEWSGVWLLFALNHRMLLFPNFFRAAGVMNAQCPMHTQYR